MSTFLYVPNDGSNTVSVIDISDNSVVATIPVGGGGADNVAVSPDGAFAYVASESGVVSVINTATRSVVDYINVGGHLAGVAFSPDGTRAYVTNYSSGGAISVIDTATNMVVSTITVGTAPYGVAFSPDGTLAYVANEGSGSVSVINTASDSVVGTISVGSAPVWVAVSPDGTEAFVSNYGSGTVSVIDTSNNSVVATIQVGASPYGVVVSPDGTRAYVASVSGTVSVIDTTNNSVVSTITVGGPVGIAISPDGAHVYVTNYSSNPTVSVIDTASDLVVGTINVGNVPIYPAIVNVNDHAPVITADAVQSIAENTTIVAALTSTDPDFVGINPTNFSITGGADSALFDIVGGNLVFKAAPDYETNPHSYQVQVSAFDGVNTTAKTITVNVTDVNDNAPVITIAATQSVGENTVFVAALTSTDADTVGINPAHFSITGGTDAALFDIVDGNLLFKTAPDFETNPHTYQVQVTASDGVNTSSELITVNLKDANDDAPVITTAATQSVAENTTIVAALASTDADTVGTNPAIFAITGGADASLFDIVGGNLVFKSAHDYETQPHSYQVQVTANDGANTTPELITVNLTDVNEAPTAVTLSNPLTSIAENTATATHIKVADITVTDDALGTNILSLMGTDATSFEIVGNVLYLKAGTVLDLETKSSYAVAVTVDDPTAGATPDATSTTYTLNVTNVPGVTITGTSSANTIDVTHTVTGQPFPTDEEDIINGGAGNDIINALGGNDIINGGTGADTMFGGAGNDTYVVDNTKDVVIENANEGIDSVQSSIAYTLGQNVENLTLTGTANLNGTGNGLDNVIRGNSGNNILAGLAGADVLDGGAGTDTATYAASTTGVNVSLTTGIGTAGDAQGDTLSNIENLTGSGFSDTLEGNAKNNVLNGGAGTDTLSYENATAGLTVNLSTTAAQNTVGAGFDTLSGFENLTGSKFNDTLIGSASANTIVGSFGNDIIKGGSGADVLTGDFGDSLVMFELDGVKFADGGTASGSFILEFVNQSIYRMIFADITTSAGTQFVGTNYNVGGIFEMRIGDGPLLEVASFANPIPNSGGLALTVDDLATTAPSPLISTSAYPGETYLIAPGQAGSRAIVAGTLDPIAAGGADTFVFSALTDSTPNAPDLITDFTHGLDLIDLSAIDANTSARGNQAFSFAGQNASTVAHSVTWYESGGNTIVQADVSGDAKADFVITLVGTNLHLSQSDFIL